MVQQVGKDAGLMEIWWTGRGIFVLPMLGLGFVIGIVGQGLFDGHTVITDILWPLGFVISAVVLRVVGRRLNYGGNGHRLMEIPVQHWAWFSVAFAVVALFIVYLLRFASNS